ncbi:DUF397 domain-containing protein [Spirillospora sp. NPDC050679]
MSTPDRMFSMWRTSSYSGSSGGECVEVAASARAVAVRDSKNPDGAMLTFDGATWAAFTKKIKAGGHGLR